MIYDQREGNLLKAAAPAVKDRAYRIQETSLRGEPYMSRNGHFFKD